VATLIRLGNSNFNPEKTTPEPEPNCFGTPVQDKIVIYQGLMVASTGILLPSKTASSKVGFTLRDFHPYIIGAPGFHPPYRIAPLASEVMIFSEMMLAASNLSM
jgi:hypothetical protein